MPGKVFELLLSMSLTGSLVILAVLLVRLLAKKLPKRITVFLWAIVFFRMLFPFSIRTPFSLFSLLPETEVIQNQEAESVSPGYQADADALSLALKPEEGSAQPAGILPETGTAEPGADNSPAYAKRPSAVRMTRMLLPVVYLAGVLAVLTVSLVRLLRLRKKLKASVRIGEDVYEADHLGAPFVLGLVRPRIYLPSGLPKEQRKLILLHERMHIRSLDPLFKLVGFMALTVHWFNPLMILAFILFSADLEMACDERVLALIRRDAYADYAESLLELSRGHRRLAAFPVSFAKTSPEKRIRRIVSYKKPSRMMLLFAVILCLLLTACLATDPREESIPSESGSSKETEDPREESGQTESTEETTEESTGSEEASKENSESTEEAGSGEEDPREDQDDQTLMERREKLEEEIDRIRSEKPLYKEQIERLSEAAIDCVVYKWEAFSGGLSDEDKAYLKAQLRVDHGEALDRKRLALAYAVSGETANPMEEPELIACVEPRNIRDERLKDFYQNTFASMGGKVYVHVFEHEGEIQASPDVWTNYALIDEIDETLQMYALTGETVAENVATDHIQFRLPWRWWGAIRTVVRQDGREVRFLWRDMLVCSLIFEDEEHPVAHTDPAFHVTPVKDMENGRILLQYPLYAKTVDEGDRVQYTRFPVRVTDDFSYENQEALSVQDQGYNMTRLLYYQLGLEYHADYFFGRNTGFYDYENMLESTVKQYLQYGEADAGE